jgi:hypothetical protein
MRNVRAAAANGTALENGERDGAVENFHES